MGNSKEPNFLAKIQFQEVGNRFNFLNFQLLENSSFFTGSKYKINNQSAQSCNQNPLKTIDGLYNCLGYLVIHEVNLEKKIIFILK